MGPWIVQTELAFYWLFTFLYIYICIYIFLFLLRDYYYYFLFFSFIFFKEGKGGQLGRGVGVERIHSLRGMKCRGC